MFWFVQCSPWRVAEYGKPLGDKTTSEQPSQHNWTFRDSCLQFELWNRVWTYTNIHCLWHWFEFDSTRQFEIWRVWIFYRSMLLTYRHKFWVCEWHITKFECEINVANAIGISPDNVGWNYIWPWHIVIKIQLVQMKSLGSSCELNVEINSDSRQHFTRIS